MLTETQKEILTTHGQTIVNLDSILNQSNAALCIEWWEVGRELSDPSYHTGIKPDSISVQTMQEICLCLGLSTMKGRNKGINGSTTVRNAMKFYKAFPYEEERNTVIARYRTWSEILTNAIMGRPPSKSSERTQSAQEMSRSRRGGTPRPSDQYSGRLITPHNTRIVWDNAIRDFMQSTHEDYATSREILFKVMSQLDYLQLMRRVWQEQYA